MAIWKRAGRALLLAVGIWLAAGSAVQAQKLEIVLKDGLWGGAIGAMLGVAQIMMMEDPENEEYRIVQGAGLGIILGVGFGFLETSGAFATYDSDNHRLMVGIPTPRFRITPTGREVHLALLDARF